MARGRSGGGGGDRRDCSYEPGRCVGSMGRDGCPGAQTRGGGCWGDGGIYCRRCNSGNGGDCDSCQGSCQGCNGCNGSCQGCNSCQSGMTCRSCESAQLRSNNDSFVGTIRDAAGNVDTITAIGTVTTASRGSEESASPYTARSVSYVPVYGGNLKTWSEIQACYMDIDHDTNSQCRYVDGSAVTTSKEYAFTDAWKYENYCTYSAPSACSTSYQSSGAGSENTRLVDYRTLYAPVWRRGVYYSHTDKWETWPIYYAGCRPYIYRLFNIERLKNLLQICINPERKASTTTFNNAFWESVLTKYDDVVRTLNNLRTNLVNLKNEIQATRDDLKTCAFKDADDNAAIAAKVWHLETLLKNYNKTYGTVELIKKNVYERVFTNYLSGNTGSGNPNAIDKAMPNIDCNIFYKVAPNANPSDHQLFEFNTLRSSYEVRGKGVKWRNLPSVGSEPGTYLGNCGIHSGKELVKGSSDHDLVYYDNSKKVSFVINQGIQRSQSISDTFLKERVPLDFSLEATHYFVDFVPIDPDLTHVIKKKEDSEFYNMINIYGQDYSVQELCLPESLYIRKDNNYSKFTYMQALPVKEDTSIYDKVIRYKRNEESTLTAPPLSAAHDLNQDGDETECLYIFENDQQPGNYNVIVRGFEFTMDGAFLSASGEGDSVYNDRLVMINDLEAPSFTTVIDRRTIPSIEQINNNKLFELQLLFEEVWEAGIKTTPEGNLIYEACIGHSSDNPTDPITHRVTNISADNHDKFMSWYIDPSVYLQTFNLEYETARAEHPGAIVHNSYQRSIQQDGPNLSLYSVTYMTAAKGTVTTQTDAWARILQDAFAKAKNSSSWCNDPDKRGHIKTFISLYHESNIGSPNPPNFLSTITEESAAILANAALDDSENIKARKYLYAYKVDEDGVPILDAEGNPIYELDENNEKILMYDNFGNPLLDTSPTGIDPINGQYTGRFSTLVNQTPIKFKGSVTGFPTNTLDDYIKDGEAETGYANLALLENGILNPYKKIARSGAFLTKNNYLIIWDGAFLRPIGTGDSIEYKRYVLIYDIKEDSIVATDTSVGPVTDISDKELLNIFRIGDTEYTLWRLLENGQLKFTTEILPESNDSISSGNVLYTFDPKERIPETYSGTEKFFLDCFDEEELSTFDFTTFSYYNPPKALDPAHYYENNIINWIQNVPTENGVAGRPAVIQLNDELEFGQATASNTLECWVLIENQTKNAFEFGYGKDRRGINRVPEFLSLFRVGSPDYANFATFMNQYEEGHSVFKRYPTPWMTDIIRQNFFEKENSSDEDFVNFKPLTNKFDQKLIRLTPFDAKMKVKVGEGSEINQGGIPWEALAVAKTMQEELFEDSLEKKTIYVSLRDGNEYAQLYTEEMLSKVDEEELQNFAIIDTLGLTKDGKYITDNAVFGEDEEVKFESLINYYMNEDGTLPEDIRHIIGQVSGSQDVELDPYLLTPIGDLYTEDAEGTQVMVDENWNVEFVLDENNQIKIGEDGMPQVKIKYPKVRLHGDHLSINTFTGKTILELGDIVTIKDSLINLTVEGNIEYEDAVNKCALVPSFLEDMSPERALRLNPCQLYDVQLDADCKLTKNGNYELSYKGDIVITGHNAEQTGYKRLNAEGLIGYEAIPYRLEVADLRVKRFGENKNLKRVPITEFVMNRDDDSHREIIVTSNDEIYIPKKGYGQRAYGDYTLPYEDPFEEGLFYEQGSVVNNAGQYFKLVDEEGKPIKNYIFSSRMFAHESFSKADKELDIFLTPRKDNLENWILDLNNLEIAENGTGIDITFTRTNRCDPELFEKLVALGQGEARQCKLITSSSTLDLKAKQLYKFEQTDRAFKFTHNGIYNELTKGRYIIEDLEGLKPTRQHSGIVATGSRYRDTLGELVTITNSNVKDSRYRSVDETGKIFYLDSAGKLTTNILQKANPDDLYGIKSMGLYDEFSDLLRCCKISSNGAKTGLYGGYLLNNYLVRLTEDRANIEFIKSSRHTTVFTTEGLLVTGTQASYIMDGQRYGYHLGLHKDLRISYTQPNYGESNILVLRDNEGNRISVSVFDQPISMADKLFIMSSL